MPITAISGAASGIGAATRAALEAAGHRVIGIDLRGSDIAADLSTPEGRAAAIAAVIDACGGTLDHLVLCAGVGPQVEPASTIVGVNYFGAVALLDGLLPALQKGNTPSAVVVSSVASVHLPWDQNPLAGPITAGDEGAIKQILEAAGERSGQLAYAGSKNAVTVAVRQRVKIWGDAGVRLNTVAPGAVATPLLQKGLDDPRYGQQIRDFVAPIPRHAQPAEIASLIAYLLGPQAGFIHGTQMFIDGGIDAAMRPTQF
ncbi:oxidoreductase [Pandoraea terrae]|uniref:Oxidoreductase n=1 Tax=Pandoraea terrae TaxID=1537710 RepID=A0A5E4YVJ3_9BURK|nr:SDR family oxidoreductase [Pandoraea terrae]VVE52345.1 oxidoreductase [Pandoraea terrae]